MGMELAIVLLSFLVVNVHGHGRLIEPPSRSTMWRYGFDTPPNYNDHESYCGGFTRQWQTNRGKCGICGDAWDEPQPRANEAGGRYGRGVITRKYRKGQSIKVRIELTANHMGHFEFRLCPNNNPAKPATQACLDRYLLEQSSGVGPSYFPGPGNRVFETQYQLPNDLTCVQCVFQWRYIAANNWGTCKNRTSKVGCGPQEEFRACSDVVITEEDGTADRTQNMDVDTWEEEEEVDLAVNWDEEVEEETRRERGVERVVIIVLASLLTATFMFGSVFIYYYKAREHVKSFMEERDLNLPSLPSLPKLKPPKRMRGLCKPLDKLGKLQWPLSSANLPSSLPSFLHKSPVVPTSPQPPPVPPPRTKRARSRTVSPTAGPRLATIVPRRPHPRPPAPGPPAPRKNPVLEISAPTEVTINGVTVASSSPMSQTAGGPTPSSRGVVCGTSGSSSSPTQFSSSSSVLSSSSSVLSTSSSSSSSSSGLLTARPAIVLADQPDSSMEPSLASSLAPSSLPPSHLSISSLPPPLPTCPPPDSLSLGPGTDSTDA